jgi:hypothetical protein
LFKILLRCRSERTWQNVRCASNLFHRGPRWKHSSRPPVNRHFAIGFLTTKLSIRRTKSVSRSRKRPMYELTMIQWSGQPDDRPSCYRCRNSSRRRLGASQAPGLRCSEYGYANKIKDAAPFVFRKSTCVSYFGRISSPMLDRASGDMVPGLSRNCGNCSCPIETYNLD